MNDIGVGEVVGIVLGTLVLAAILRWIITEILPIV